MLDLFSWQTQHGLGAIRSIVRTRRTAHPGADTAKRVTEEAGQHDKGV
jgi:hypothetical protein